MHLISPRPSRPAISMSPIWRPAGSPRSTLHPTNSSKSWWSVLTADTHIWPVKVWRHHQNDRRQKHRRRRRARAVGDQPRRHARQRRRLRDAASVGDRTAGTGGSGDSSL